jgi:hypothetical protein
MKPALGINAQTIDFTQSDRSNRFRPVRFVDLLDLDAVELFLALGITERFFMNIKLSEVCTTGCLEATFHCKAR